MDKHSNLHLSFFQIVGAWWDFTAVTKLIKSFNIITWSSKQVYLSKCNGLFSNFLQCATRHSRNFISVFLLFLNIFSSKTTTVIFSKNSHFISQTLTLWTTMECGKTVSPLLSVILAELKQRQGSERTCGYTWYKKELWSFSFIAKYLFWNLNAWHIMFNARMRRERQMGTGMTLVGLHCPLCNQPLGIVVIHNGS